MFDKLPPLWIQILISMVLGVAVGLPLNLLTDGFQQWKAVDATELTPLTPDWVTQGIRKKAITITNEGEGGGVYQIRGQKKKAKGTEGEGEGDSPELEEIVGLQGLEAGASQRYEIADEWALIRVEVRGNKMSARGVGGTLDRGVVLQVASVGKWIGDIFLTLLKMIVVPLIFASLVVSITAVGGQKGFARLGTRTAAYYIITSLLAITVGLIFANAIQPGIGLDYNELMSAAEGELAIQQKTLPTTLQEGASTWSVLGGIFKRMIPQNVIKAASVNRELLAVIFFALVFGFAIVKVGGAHTEILSRFFKAVEAVMTKLTHGILYTAPIGIFGFLVYVTAATGLTMAKNLGLYMLTVFLGLLVHAVVTLPLMLWVLTKRSPFQYFRAMREALATAFSTASSAATLPLTIRCVTKNAKVPERVTSFTLPLGATVNMDGTALYEAAAVLFIAQMYSGHLSLGQQVVVVVTALLASIGAAGIPHAGTVMMVIVLQAVGLPTDAVLLILAVDRVLDMCRTTVNVWSDSIGAAIIARFEPADTEPTPAAAPAET